MPIDGLHLTSTFSQYFKIWLLCFLLQKFLKLWFHRIIRRLGRLITLSWIPFLINEKDIEIPAVWKVKGSPVRLSVTCDTQTWAPQYIYVPNVTCSVIIGKLLLEEGIHGASIGAIDISLVKEVKFVVCSIKLVSKGENLIVGSLLY